MTFAINILILTTWVAPPINPALMLANDYTKLNPLFNISWFVLFRYGNVS